MNTSDQSPDAVTDAMDTTNNESSPKKETANNNNKTTTVSPSNEGTPTGTSDKTKKKPTSSSKKKKPPASGTASAMNKTYIQLVMEAINALKDYRTGSSLAAIKKHILTHYPDLDGPHFASRVNQALKGGLKSNKLTKIRASYKIHAEFKKKKKAASKKATASKPQPTSQKLPPAFEKSIAGKPQAEQTKLRQQYLQKQQKEEVAKKKMAEQLKRRRFPMEDTKLHAEDKLFKVKPPQVGPRPHLPYFWQFPTTKRSGKTPGLILQHSKVEHLESGCRGLVPDVFSVYHFFRGDVHFTFGDDHPSIVPDFSLQQLVYAVEQVRNGNAKKSKQVPVLLVHLFVTCLQILLKGSSMETIPNKKQLYDDFRQFLEPALTPCSWSDVCFLYMDAMERYYTADVSLDPNVLPPLPASADFVLGKTDEIPTVPEATGYGGYLGDANGTLYRAQQKLSKMDPWLLTPEELLALLRALTEDVLALHPHIMDDRDEQMSELRKAKYAADTKFRKVRLAFEGPTKKPKKKDDEAPAEPEEPFKPTATKKQFEKAQRAQEKANDAYEAGIRKLVARTEPVGYDRHFNAVYCFRHDPEVLYVEERRPAPSTSAIPKDLQYPRFSWHFIENTSTLDQFVASLDVRGRRENDLNTTLVGETARQSLRRFLHDDVGAAEAAKAKVKEKQALLAKLEKAKVKCDEEQGRRSGRLAGQAETELMAVQAEIHEFERVASRPAEVSVPEKDYEELTGLALLQQFEDAARYGSRRTREAKIVIERTIPLMYCGKLCKTGNIDGTGLVGMLVSSLLELEEHCESLAPWERKDITRDAWIAKLEGVVPLWNGISPDVLGSPDRRQSIGGDRRLSMESTAMDSSPMLNTPGRAKRDSLDSVSISASKRRRFDSPSATTSTVTNVPSILVQLRQPLLDLEARVADISNLALASRDADLADDNMSVDSESNEVDEVARERVERAWKKLVHKIRQTPTKRYSQIREFLVAAIGTARKAHLPQVVAQLRAALLQYHPNAASDCKVAAIKVLEEHGDYEEDEDEDLEDVEATEESKEEAPIPSVMSADAAILRSSMGGSEDASRSDWVTTVKATKTLSRMSSLIASFIHDAMEKIEKIEDEREELTAALKAWNRGGRTGKKKSSNQEEPSEVWANVVYTDEIVMAKTDEFPWWPAKKCIAKDTKIAENLDDLNRSLVAFVGEMGGLRVVKTENLKPFTGKPIEDDNKEEFTKEVQATLDDCMAMARRILRGTNKR